MPKRIQKWLVIDASVGATAGSGDAEAGTPKEMCRLCLRTVRANAYGVFFYPQTWEEWTRHRSEYSKQWLYEMYSRKRLAIQPEEELTETGLRIRLRQLSGKKIGTEKLTDAICDIMLKDCHLLEAALAKDKTVISLDDTARNHFKSVISHIKEIKIIVWANPNQTSEEIAAWLESGAKPEKRRMLGFQEEVS